MNSRVRFGVSAFTAALLAIALPSCSASRPASLPSSVRRDAPINAVMVGDGASLSFRGPITVTNSWPQLFFREALPRNATFVNLATFFATTGEARDREGAVLAPLHANLVMVFVGFRDFEENVPVAKFASDLAGLLDDIRRAGVRKVLLAIPPTPDRKLVAYASVVARSAAMAHGALAITAVDLRPLALSYVPDTSERFIPTVESQRTIADAFIAAYKKIAPSATP